MRILFLVVIFSVMVISCDKKNQTLQINEDQIEKELLMAIEQRFYSWRDNNLQSYLETYHEDWRRWDRRDDSLRSKNDIAIQWEKGKMMEEPISMTIELIDYNILGDGSVAIVHFKTVESFKWIGEDIPPYIESNSIYEGVNRWSDILVKENDKWLCIGGHRDRSQSPQSLTKLSE